MITDRDMSDGSTIACLRITEVEEVARAVYYATKTLKKIMKRVPA